MGDLRVLALLALMMMPTNAAAAPDSCTNPSADAIAKFLPPKAYRHEPKMKFVSTPRSLLRIITKTGPNYETYGAYFDNTKVIFICQGLTGAALRYARMHEEAHAMGWRH